ncbi:SOS response-associated peptidase family protein [Herbaspirillum lusitanum]|uniref:Abasic site processing protein n=1 Tax=Herbaspirillum lusitanum TaxID=213312 RepID=A0ABW9ABH8_9BURK
MCSRISQPDDVLMYAGLLGWHSRSLRLIAAQADWPSFNAAPRLERLVFRVIDGKPTADLVRWECQSDWAKERGLAGSTRLKCRDVEHPRYRDLLEHGRVIVPVKGWFEWTEEEGERQPWYVTGKSGLPLYLAAVCNYHPHHAGQEGNGFMLLTDNGTGGTVSSENRAPVVLSAQNARDWMNPDLKPEQAYTIASRNAIVSHSDLKWYRVSSAVNSVEAHGQGLIEPAGIYA